MPKLIVEIEIPEGMNKFTVGLYEGGALDDDNYRTVVPACLHTSDLISLDEYFLRTDPLEDSFKLFRFRGWED